MTSNGVFIHTDPLQYFRLLQVLWAERISVSWILFTKGEPTCNWLIANVGVWFFVCYCQRAGRTGSPSLPLIGSFPIIHGSGSQGHIKAIKAINFPENLLAIACKQRSSVITWGLVCKWSASPSAICATKWISSTSVTSSGFTSRCAICWTLSQLRLLFLEKA